MNCQECKYKRLQEESMLAMAERTIRRLWITVLVLIVLMAGMATGFFIYEAQFEEVETVEESDVDIDATQVGHNNFVSGGDLTYGDTESESESP
jgi:hypothetical protein